MNSIRLCCFVLCYSSWWQHSGIRYKMGRSSTLCQNVHPMRSWKVCTNWEYVSSKPHLNCTTWRFIWKNLLPTIKSWQPWYRSHKLRLRNFDAWHGRIESGAVVKSRKGLIGVEGGKGTCYHWKEKGQCSKGDQCSFRNETQDRAQKPEHTAATPAEPAHSRGRSRHAS